MFGNHKNITPITVILLSSKLENLKKNFEASEAGIFSEANPEFRGLVNHWFEYTHTRKKPHGFTKITTRLRKVGF